MALVDYSDSEDDLTEDTKCGKRQLDHEENDFLDAPAKKRQRVVSKTKAKNDDNCNTIGSKAILHNNNITDNNETSYKKAASSQVVNVNDSDTEDNEEDTDSDVNDDDNNNDSDTASDSDSDSNSDATHDKNKKAKKFLFNKAKLENAKKSDGCNSIKSKNKRNFLQSKYDNDAILQRESKLHQIQSNTDEKKNQEKEKKLQNKKQDNMSIKQHHGINHSSMISCATNKNKNRIKEKEKMKRMKGQSSHATWKSETFMKLRQEFD